MVTSALTIAGSDSSGGGGIQRDLAVFAALGVYGCCAVTAVTAQDTSGIRRIHYIPPVVLGAQIDAVSRDLHPLATKIGMLGRHVAVGLVAGRVRRSRLSNVVLDPVIAAKDGTRLLSERSLATMKAELLPQVAVLTPNVTEAERLAGIRIGDRDSLVEAGTRLLAWGVGAVVIKGGHLEGKAVDTLITPDRIREFGGERIAGPPVRGTGCAFSAALAAHLATGRSLDEACAAASAYVRAMILGALDIGKGARVGLTGVQTESPGGSRG